MTSAKRAASPTTKRPKFDKAASTTYLLAALVGLGAGATWRLTEGVQRPSSTEDVPRTATAERQTPPSSTQVIVIDTEGRLVATYDGVRLTGAAENARPAVSIAQGRSRAAMATTRAS